MQYKTLTEDQYNQELIAIIKATEDQKESLYADGDNGEGLLTIGWGFNIETNSVLKSVLIKGLKVTSVESGTGGILYAKIQTIIKDSSLNKTQQITQINEAWSTYKGETGLTLSLTEDQMKAVFLDIKDEYENKIDGFQEGIPDSYERVALFSLAYNQDDNDPLLGNGLGGSFDVDSRVQAWFEIAYLSNGGAHAEGQAKRRMVEAC